MKINNVFPERHEQTPQKKSSVVIATNLRKERVVLDNQGNQIDLKTRRIINKA